jgi:hypothetical protein
MEKFAYNAIYKHIDQKNIKNKKLWQIELSQTSN